MEAPKEIYIPKEYIKSNILPVGVTKKAVFDGDIKYIRADKAVNRDALLEWAFEQRGKYIEVSEQSNDVLADGYVEALVMVIDKINEL